MALVNVPAGVVTFTKPIVAPTGTVAVIRVSELTMKAAPMPLKVTLVAPVSFVPKMRTVAPTLPEVGSVSTNGPSPTDRSKIEP